MSSSEFNWDDVLRDIDFSSLTNPNSLLSRVYAPGSGSRPQRLVYELAREELRPTEMYYQQQAEEFGNLRVPPKGVRKIWDRFYFSADMEGGVVLPASLRVRKNGERYQPLSFGISHNLVEFDNEGKIKRVKVTTKSGHPRTRDFWEGIIQESIDNETMWMELLCAGPEKMGVIYKIGSSRRAHSVGVTGFLDGHENPNPHVFPRFLKRVLAATHPV